MRTRVKKVLPKASTPEARMAEVTEPLEPTDSYRGLPNLRWKYGRLSKSACAPLEFLVAAKCPCGRWWGWVVEARRAELLELVAEGCPGCSQ